MANNVYDRSTSKWPSGELDWLVDTFRIIFVDTGVYTFSTIHEFFSDLTGTKGESGGTGRASGVEVTNKVIVAGEARVTAPVVATAVAAGTALGGYVLYKDTGADATSPLLAIVETATGLPVTPTGDDIEIDFSTVGYVLRV